VEVPLLDAINHNVDVVALLLKSVTKEVDVPVVVIRGDRQLRVRLVLK
jgi:hypothetical protein